MEPITTISLPFTSILQSLNELSSFLSGKGLVDGWDTIPVTINNQSFTWVQLIRVYLILLISIIVFESYSTLESRCYVK